MTHTRIEVAEAIEAGAEQIETYGLTPLSMIRRLGYGDAPDTQRPCCPVGGIRARAGIDVNDGQYPLTEEAISELAAWVVEYASAAERPWPETTVFEWVAAFQPTQAAAVATVMRECAADVRRSA